MPRKSDPKDLPPTTQGDADRGRLALIGHAAGLPSEEEQYQVLSGLGATGCLVAGRQAAEVLVVRLAALGRSRPEISDRLLMFSEAGCTLIDATTGRRHRLDGLVLLLACRAAALVDAAELAEDRRRRRRGHGRRRGQPPKTDAELLTMMALKWADPEGGTAADIAAGAGLARETASRVMARVFGCGRRALLRKAEGPRIETEEVERLVARYLDGGPARQEKRQD